MSTLNNTNFPHQFDYLFYPTAKAYFKAVERERREKEREEKKREYENLPSVIYKYQLPFYANNEESYSLLYYLLTGKTRQSHYLNPRHKWIHSGIKKMRTWNEPDNLGTRQLIRTLEEEGWLSWAGGADYVTKLFGELDVSSILYKKEW